MQLEVVTPRGSKVKADVSQLTAPGTVGEVGILPGHRPLLSSLGIGVLSYTTGGETRFLAVNGGYLEVADDRLIVITETAEAPTDIDLERARAALERSNQRVKETEADPNRAEELQLALDARRRAETRLQVARFVRSAPPPA